MKQRYVCTFASFVILAAGACGGSSTPTTPAPPAPFNVSAGGTLGPSEYTAVPFTAPRAGAATIEVSWTGSGNIDIYLTGPSCEAFPLGGACPILSMSQTMSANPEQIIRNVQAGEQFKVFAANRPINGSQMNTLTYTVSVKIP